MSGKKEKETLKQKNITKWQNQLKDSLNKYKIYRNEYRKANVNLRRKILQTNRQNRQEYRKTIKQTNNKRNNYY